MTTLWHIRIDDDDWEYDRFAEAVVWADTPEEAEEIIRREPRYPPGAGISGPWIEYPHWRLHVQPAKTSGVALVHWHAG